MVFSNVLFLTSGYDQVIKFWDPLSATCTRTIPYPESHVNTMALSSDKKYLLVGSNPNCRVFDVAKPGGNSANTPVLVYQGHTGNVTAVGAQRDFKWIFTGSEDKKIKIWDTKHPRCRREYLNNSPINYALLHPNQGEIWSIDQRGSLKIWDLVSDTCTQELIPEEGVPGQSISLCPLGSLAAMGNYKGNIYLWRLQGGTGGDQCELLPVALIRAHSNSYITKVLISPDGKRLASASRDGTIKIWSTLDFTLVRSLVGHSKWVWDVAFSADSAYLISASSDQTAKLWDAASGEVVRTYSGHEKAITALAMNDFVEVG